jgi:hypothetical protein
MDLAKTGRDWMKLKHGDDVTLTVTEEDQRNGIPGSPTRCAVVQTIFRSSPNVYDVKVKEGDIQLWVHGKDNKDWRGRLVMDNATRELAIKYDQHIASAPTTIELRMDKWHEVAHYTRAPKAAPVQSELVLSEPEQDEPAKDEQAADTTHTREVTVATTDEQTPKTPAEPPVSPKPRGPRAPKKSRWDISNYLVPANVGA